MTQQTKKPLWTKSFIMLIVGNLFIFMSFQMLLPAMPPYIKSIGASGLEVGLVTALFSVGAVLSRPFVGFILQFKARKLLVLIGAISLLSITIMYPISQIIIIVLLFRFVHGLAWGWSTTVNGTAAVDVVPDARIGEGMGYYGLSVTVGMLVAPSLGIYLYQVTSFTNLIYVSGFLGITAIILLSIVKYPTPEVVKNTRKEDLKFSYMDSLIEKKGMYPALITVMASFGYGSIATFIVIFGEERGIEHIFLYYFLNALFATLVRPFAGKWFDRRGPKALVIFCSAATFVGMWVLSFAHSNIGIAVAGLLFGVGFGTLIPTLQSWTLSITPESRRGVANGMLFSSIDLGIGLGGVVFGFLALFFETGTLFQIASFFLIGAIILTLLEGREKRVAKRQVAS